MPNENNTVTYLRRIEIRRDLRKACMDAAYKAARAYKRGLDGAEQEYALRVYVSDVSVTEIEPAEAGT